MASSIDLSTTDSIRYATTVDVVAGLFTISLTDSDTDVSLGMLTFPLRKARSLLEHLELVASINSNIYELNEVVRAKYDSTSGLGSIEFVQPPETRL